MRSQKRINWVPWAVFIILIFVSDYVDNCNRQQIYAERIQGTTISIPDASKGEALFYSIQKHDWVYAIPSGAKAPIYIREPYSRTQEDLDEYLQKNIPIYKNRTYWGEEWTDDEDKPDDIWDDEGDDNNLDPEYKKK